MKKFFEQPEIAVTKLDVEDIITVSGDDEVVTDPSHENQTPLG